MKDSFFSKKNRRLITDPFDGQNPITVQVLGICSALAITVQLQQALIMALSVVVVMICGNMIVSLLRNVIPSRIRIIVQLVVVSALVVLVDLVLKAFLPDMSEKLSVFVGLIVSNCIIMGRLEAFALGNKLWPSFLDGLGNAIGYGWILLAVAFLALRDLVTRKINNDIHSITISLYAFILTIVGGVISIPFFGPFVSLTVTQWLVVFAITLFGVFSYLMLVLATRRGDISVISPFRYTRLVFALILAMLILNERPDILTLTGATIIVASGYYTIWRERVLGT